MKFFAKALILSSLIGAVACAAADPAVGPRCEFDSQREMDEHWRTLGAFGVFRKTKFFIADEASAGDGRVLVVEAKRASGFLVFRLNGLDLEKYPYMRWRWRVVRRLSLPDGVREPDDQVCVIYITDGSTISQTCVAYRWEHNTKVGFRQMLDYAGLRIVEAFCVRNKETPVGEWVVDERNVLADYKAAFGRAPSEKFVISVGGNSQHSNSDTRAEIDYIEFRSAPAPKK
jgi:hypothetical protein